MPYAPTTAMWKLTLDREIPVQARGKGVTHRVRQVYVGPVRSRRLLMAGPANVRAERTSAIADAPGDRIDMVAVPVLAGETLSFEPVEALDGGSEQ
jgi:hypothetical protein